MTDEDIVTANDKNANKGPVVVERTFDAPATVVWQALTEKALMKHWYFDVAEFRPEVGFEFRFVGGTETKEYLHICVISEVIPLRKLTHSWRYDGYEGMTHVTFELFPGVPVASGKTARTKVRLTHRGLETFPGDNPDFARENFEEGWSAIIGTSLKTFVEQRQSADR